MPERISVILEQKSQMPKSNDERVDPRDLIKMAKFVGQQVGPEDESSPQIESPADKSSESADEKNK